MKALSSSLSRSEIAEKLNISTATVDYHLRRHKLRAATKPRTLTTQSTPGPLLRKDRPVTTHGHKAVADALVAVYLAGCSTAMTLEQMSRHAGVPYSDLFGAIRRRWDANPTARAGRPSKVIQLDE